MSKSSGSELLDSIYEMADGLNNIGLMDEDALREFYDICYGDMLKDPVKPELDELLIRTTRDNKHEEIDL